MPRLRHRSDLRRLHPSHPEEALQHILRQLAESESEAEAAGEWYGVRRPEPLSIAAGDILRVPSRAR